ncbi:MAG: hypothetical protein ACK5WZ_03585 [Pseudobdellovibrionaceae bacterium]
MKTIIVLLASCSILASNVSAAEDIAQRTPQDIFSCYVWSNKSSTKTFGEMHIWKNDAGTHSLHIIPPITYYDTVDNAFIDPSPLITPGHDGRISDDMNCDGSKTSKLSYCIGTRNDTKTEFTVYIRKHSKPPTAPSIAPGFISVSFRYPNGTVSFFAGSCTK